MVIMQGHNLSHAGNHNIELIRAVLRCLQTAMNSEGVFLLLVYRGNEGHPEACKGAQTHDVMCGWGKNVFVTFVACELL